MPNIRIIFNTYCRLFISTLIFALALLQFGPPPGYAQQPPRQQPPQERILTGQGSRTNTDKPSGPREVRPELVLQTGVTFPVYNVIFSPDGRLLASMDVAASSVKLWEVSTGRELFAIDLGARAEITTAFTSAFAFNPDGSSLFTFRSGALRQWDTRTGRQVRAIEMEQGQGFSDVRISADARILVRTMQASPSLESSNAVDRRSASDLVRRMQTLSSSLEVWDIASGRKLKELNTGGNLFQYSGSGFTLSPDGRTLASMTPKGMPTVSGGRMTVTSTLTLTLLDVASERIIQTITVPERKNKSASIGSRILGPYSRGERQSTIDEKPLAIRFSPDGRAVAIAFVNDSLTMKNEGAIPLLKAGQLTGVYNRTIEIRAWDISSGREMAPVVVDSSSSKSQQQQQSSAPMAFAFTNDYRQCAITIDKTINLFDPAAGRNLGTLTGHTDEVYSVTFSADGKLLATTSKDGTIKIWDVSTAATGRVELARTLSGKTLPVEGAAFSNDGRALAVSSSNMVGVWELNTGAALRSLTRPPAVTSAIESLDQPQPSVFSPGGQFVAAKSGANEIKLWETRTGREVRSFPISQGKKYIGASVSPDGKWIALAEGKDEQLFMTSTVEQNDSKKDEKPSRKEQMERYKQETERMNQEMERDKQERNVERQMTSQEKKDWQELERQLKEAVKNGDTDKISETQEKMSEIRWRILSNTPGYQPRASFKLWEVNSTSEPRSLPFQMTSRDGLNFNFVSAFNNNGSLLASNTGLNSIKINETSSGRELLTLKFKVKGNPGYDGSRVTDLAWSVDGRMLASSHEGSYGSGPYSIKLWDAATGRELQTMSGHTATIGAMAFSPDGRLLASGGYDSSVKLWDTATGREITTLDGHSVFITALTFSNDGKILFSGSYDGSVRLWDVKSGETLATLLTLNDGADWLVVTPDGLFDGTPGAWSQILWRFNPDNIFDVAPVENFFNDFFYPGLLADIASGKRPKAAKDVAQKDRRQPILNLSRADGQKAGRTIKVKLDISEPDSAGQATPAGASDVRLFRNGTLVKVWRGDALKGQKQTTLEAEIPIVAGENRILAYAFNHDGVKSSDAVLNVTGDDSLRRKGVAYVIACGVNQYANPQYNLKYAVPDATSFGAEVSAQQSKLNEYERVEVISLLDKDATKANILLALKRLSNGQLAIPAGAPSALSRIRQAQPEDAIFIFFAGHGVAHGSRFYLIPHDISYTGARNSLTADAVKTILSHGVSDLELESAIEGVDAGRLLFVVDACNSGQALEAEEKRRGPMNSSGLAQLAYEKGMYILTAAQSYQAALEAAQLGHGYLTFALIEDGLKKGLADRDPKDGQALAREWFNFAEERVPQMQESEMQTRLLLNFAVNEAKDPKQRDIQRPRVFYRRELEAHPFVIAKP